jgi:glycogen operon protein
VVSRAVLAAEPWDVGRMDRYDVGRFPAGWSEWNGRYRDCVRDFWRSHDGLIAEFANRISGSADLYALAGRRPTASVNLVTVHDGFTLTDLVSYDEKHNEANGEDNRDGSTDNRSWNCGAEGPTDDQDVLALRARQRRAMLATLLLSAGLPLLLGGDEIGRTQRGNNNAYCQDNALSWFNWAEADRDLLAFTRDLIRLRRAHPVLRRRRFLTGAAAADLRWFTPAGTAMTDADWADSGARAIAVFFEGQADPEVAADGTLLVDDDLLVLVNAWWEPLACTVPVTADWRIVCDTHTPSRSGPADPTVSVGPRSLVVLLAPSNGESPDSTR